METKISNEIKVGETVWIRYDKAEYLGFEDGKHKVKIQKKDEEIIKKVDMVLPEDGYEPPKFLKDGRCFLQFTGKKTAWERNGGLAFYYYYRSTSIFKSEEILGWDSIQSKEVIDGSIFWDAEKVCEELDKISDDTRPIENQIHKLKIQLAEINKRKEPVYRNCFHEWEKGEEEKTGGSSYQQICTCINCGKEDINSYSKF